MNTSNSKKNSFEIEHIITDHYEWFANEYNDKDDFNNYRNNIGALVLLRKSLNASLNDNLYEDKLPKYASSESNIYAASLNDITYQNNPRFLRFINDNEIPLKSFKQFGKKEIVERNKALAVLMNMIWNEEMFIIK